jgi:glycine/D-amino acid oxidase-like deaminating enzyme
MNSYDVAIVGAGPGGLAGAIKAKELGLRYLLLEKGTKVFQGIIDSYPRGKKVYPTIPKGEPESFAIAELEPDCNNAPIETYLEKVAAGIRKFEIQLSLGEEFQELRKDRDGFILTTSKSNYRTRTIVLAFGSNVPVDLGEEILLGGNIKILQGAVPRIGEVDEEGVERLLVQTRAAEYGKGVKFQQWMSFPMKHVIACIGTQGPSPVFDRIGLQQITCTEGVYVIVTILHSPQIFSN